jgi:hypothetical protein
VKNTIIAQIGSKLKLKCCTVTAVALLAVNVYSVTEIVNTLCGLGIISVVDNGAAVKWVF